MFHKGLPATGHAAVHLDNALISYSIDID